MYFSFFFFNDTATTEIYTLSLHDALPILGIHSSLCDVLYGHACREQTYSPPKWSGKGVWAGQTPFPLHLGRSEEHTSELQSHLNLVCRLLLEKKKNNKCLYHY